MIAILIVGAAGILGVWLHAPMGGSVGRRRK